MGILAAFRGRPLRCSAGCSAGGFACGAPPGGCFWGGGEGLAYFPPLVAPADRWSKYFSELTFSGSLTLVHNAFSARYHVLLVANQTSTET